MLTRLTVSNFAIIDYSEVNFSSNFNVITGETGAGKSILLGALSLILGNRADLSVLSDSTKKCVVEAYFKVNEDQKTFFDQHELDFDQETIIRRELSPTGKSRAFINDTPVNLNLLKELTNQLVDLHQQNDSRSVAESDFQRQLVDVFAKSINQVKKFAVDFKQLQAKRKQLSKILKEQEEKQQQQDYLDFQFTELQEANLRSGEMEKIETQLKLANNAEEIDNLRASIYQLLELEESNVLSLSRNALSAFRRLSKLSNNFEQPAARFESIVIELEDFLSELNSLDHSSDIDEEELPRLQERVDVLNRLLKKHQKNNEEELILLRDELGEELDSIGFLKEDIDQIQKDIEQLQNELTKEAKSITKARMAIMDELSGLVKNLLAKVGMPNAEFIIDVKTVELNAYGQDEIVFLFNANKGKTPQPIKQIASGGELSRLMLALKSVVAGNSTLPTLIFDEIDTGISGEVAKKVGNVMFQLGAYHQVIAITHSPQVAAKGNEHFKIFKEDNSTGSTVSTVKRLNKEERINEIAEMLGGANPSKSSLSAAEELMT